MKLTTEPTDDPAIEHYVERVRLVLDSDIPFDFDGAQKAVAVYRLHQVLVKDERLYMQVAEALAERGILSKQSLKDCVMVGKELCGD